MNDPQSFTSKDTLLRVEVWHDHGGNNPSINGNVEYTFRNDADTQTYCTSFIANTGSFRYDNVTPSGCNWTYSKLQDLVINVKHGGTRQDLYNDYINLTIYYTPYNDTAPPSIALGNPANDSFSTNSNITFYFTPVDDNNITNCSLLINDTINNTIYSVTNGTQNNIWGVLQDGYWLWTINCTDSWNNTGTNTSQKLIKVDTTPPSVNLESPANNTLWFASPDVVFYFNVTDIMTNITSCELIVDGQSRDTKSSPAEGTSLNFTFGPGNGQHNWSVNCTDGNGLEGASDTYNVTVNYTGRTVQTNKLNYKQGENVTIIGDNWNDGTITINLTLSNNSLIQWNTTAASGSFSTWYFLNYSHPLSLQNITVWEYLTPSLNANNTFNVTPRTATIFTDKETYLQGDTVLINGTGFSPNGTVTVLIEWAAGSNTTNVSADQTGYIEYNYTLNYSAYVGAYNITAYDFFFSNLNDTENFTVQQRVANITTDKLVYGANENVYITGLLFSILGKANLTIFDNSTNATAPFFPVEVDTNSTGGFNYTWNTTDTCPGVYGVRGIDLNYTFLNDTYYFNLTGDTVDYGLFPNASREWDGGANTLSNQFYEDDSNEEAVSITGTNWIEVNFTGSIDSAAEIVSITFYIKHYVSDTDRITYDHLEWYNESSGSYQTVSGCNIQTHATNQLDNCVLNNYIKNGTQANNISLRVFYARSGGPTQTAYVDYTHINLTAGGTGACTDWAAQPPSITYIVVDDNQTAAPNEIDLNAGTITPVTCNVTVYDYNGWATIQGLNSTFYYYLNNSGDPDDNSTHYTDRPCTETGNDADKRKYFLCEYNVIYYANNGTWYCNATTWDNGGNVVSATDQTDINTLAAINVTPLIDFGNLETGSISPADINTTVSNFGNIQVDISLEGYGAIDGDNISMNCTDGNNISINDERYSLTFGQAFVAMTAITDDPVNLTGFNLAKQINSTFSQRDVYWKVRATPPTIGECDGTVVFTAQTG